MLDIKELTWEHHKNAERQDFVRILMSGNIDEKLYATYLYNQLQCYSVLEKYGLHNSLFRDTPNLLRAEHIHYDYRALWTDIGLPPEITQSTKEYVEHIKTITDDPEKLYAHIYVRHMGDLSGGQMIKRKVPGLGKYYEFKFNKNPEHGITYKDTNEIKEALRLAVDSHYVYNDASDKDKNVNNVVYEARQCFGFATDLFKEMLQFIKNNEKRFGDGTTK